MSNVKKGRSDCFCINLRRAATAVSDLYDSYLTPIGISVTQYSLLGNLSRMENCSVSDLANYIGLERTTVVRTLRPLMEKGLIMDCSSAGQRNRVLALTDTGRETLKKARVLWEEAQEEIERLIGREEAEAFRETLQKLNKCCMAI